MSVTQLGSNGTNSDNSGEGGTLTADIIDLGRFLAQLLEQNEGRISSDQVLKEGPKILSLNESDFRKMHDQIRKLSPKQQEVLRNDLGIDIHYQRRQWLTRERKNLEADQRASAAAAEAEIADTDENADTTQDEPKRSPNKQEEWRMSSYIMDYLSDLYMTSRFVPADTEVAFDVCDQRRKIKGTSKGVWENIDVLAVDWRSDTAVDLVAVEAKLSFTSDAVMQAISYTRFADRVWLAVGCQTDSPLEDLLFENRSLLDFAVGHGLGILCCKMGRGRSYDIIPVSYPRKQNPDEIERDRFKERYSTTLEAAKVLQPGQNRRYPVR